MDENLSVNQFEGLINIFFGKERIISPVKEF